MELIYTDQAMQKQGVIRDFALDMAFGDSENDFQLTMPTPQSKRMGIDRDAVIETRSGTGSIEIQEANGSILQGLSVDGKSEQVRHSGKNLVSGVLAVESIDNSGVSFAATNRLRTEYTSVNSGTSYTLKTNAQSPVFQIGNVFWYTASKQFIKIAGEVTAWATQQTVTAPANAVYMRTVMRKSNDAACSTSDNPMLQLERGTTATEYEPYVGGIPSPNPDYPQPVQVVEGRNLLNVIEQGAMNGDGTNGTLDNYNIRLRSKDYISLQKGHTYTLSANGFQVYARSETGWGNTGWLDTYTFTPTTTERFRFMFRRSDNSNVTPDMCKAQLERGSVATPYVPYGALELVVRGRNLLDESALNASSSTIVRTPLYVGRGTVTLSSTCPLDNGGANLFIKAGNTTASMSTGVDGVYYGKSVTVQAVDGYVTIGSRKNKNYSLGDYSSILAFGETATPYEPYIEPTRTTLDLQGHRLASLPDGTNDELTVNAAGRVQLINRVGVVDLGTLTYDYHATYKTFPCYNFSLQNMADGTPNMYCSMYIGATWASAATDATKNGTICSLPSATQIRIRNTAYTDKAVFKAAMSGVMLYYELATPQTYDLGTIELPQTLNGYTRITLDATIDAPFSVEYEAAPASKSYTVEVIPHLQSGALVYDFGTDIGGIVDSEVFDSTGDIPVMAYSGRTWYGILDASITRPNSGQGYLTLTGDINAAIGTLISRAGLGSVFEAGSAAGVSVNYQVPRYISVWEALRRLCKAYGMRPSIHRDNGKTIVEAVRKQYYSNGSVSELSMPLSFGRDYRPVNHLVVLGQGELAARTVFDLYADSDGNVSTTQTLFGADEVAEVYENTNEADAAKLREDGIKKLQELQRFASADMALPQNEQFQIGDTVTAYSTEVGLMAAAEVVKKVVTVGEDGFAITDYELGEPAIKAYR